MAGERTLRILTLLQAAGGSNPGNRLGPVAVEVTGASGASVMIISDDRPQASAYSTDDTARLLEELQFTTGEGPCIDAHRLGVFVVEPDLAAQGPTRWMAFSPLALEAGARAVFGIPLRIGVVRIGALNLYRDGPGRLSDDQHADALVLADVAARTLLADQASAAADQLGSDLGASADNWQVVHQAAGMVSVQLTITVAEALLRLRAHAFAHDRPVTDVARDIVERHLRFDARS